MTTTTQTSPAQDSPTQAQWDAANKFLGQLFLNSTLAQGYLNICQQANGQPNAPELLNNWLQQQGYATTPELVYAALIALQNISLSYWSGVYGQSFFQDTQGHTSVAPVLAIIPDAEGNAIPYLDGVALKNFTFKSVIITNNIPNPTLTWGLDSNSSAGNIIFYYTPPVNENPEPPTGYTGNWFQGTLQTSATTSPETYYAGLGQSNGSEPTPLQTQENYTYNPFGKSFYSGDNWQIILAYLGGFFAAIGLAWLIYKKIKVSKIQIDDLQTEESISFKYVDKKKIKFRDIRVEVQDNGTMITYEYLPNGTMITNPPVVRTLIVTNPDGYYMEDRLVEDGQIGDLVAFIGNYGAYVQPNPPENIRNNLMSLEENKFSRPPINLDQEDPLNPRKTLEAHDGSNFQEAPISSSSQQPESPKAPETSSEPPASQTQPVPPEENPFQQQQQIEAGQSQENPVPPEQQPVQSSQADKIESTNLNAEMSATQPPPVEQTPPKEPTSPETEEKTPFDPLAEGE